MGVARITIVCLCALTGVAFSALVTTGCGKASVAAEASPEPTPGGTYVVPLEADPIGVDPANTFDSESAQVNHQVFQCLVRWETGSDGVTRGAPCLAESWSVNDDATVWTFRLRRGVRFQPPAGREVTAADVVADWEYLTDPAVGSPVSYLLASVRGTDESGYAGKGLTGVEAPERYTLRVTLKYPFADFPLVLGNPATGIWPVDYMKKISPEAFRKHPVGTGPYMVEHWVSGQYIDLVRNPDYWDPETAGFVDRIHLPVMDLETQWQELQRDTLDISSVPADQIPGLRDRAEVRNGGWKLVASPSAAVIMIGVSQKSPRLGGAVNLPRRRALSYAVDRDALAEVTRDAGMQPSLGTPATGVVPACIPHADAGGLPYPSEPRLATQLVQQLGTLPGLLYLSWGAAPEATQGLAVLDGPLLAGWRAAGLRVEREGYEWSTYIRRLSLGTEGDLFVTGWIADYPAADDFLYPLFHSGSSGAESIATFYEDPDVDRLLEEARGTLDEGRRLDLYARAERMVLADAPVIPLYFCGNLRVASARVQGQAIDPWGSIDMWEVWVK